MCLTNLSRNLTPEQEPPQSLATQAIVSKATATTKINLTTSCYNHAQASKAKLIGTIIASNPGAIVSHSHSPLRAQEKKNVRWKDDDNVWQCSFCQTVFCLQIRKHHCRLCAPFVCLSPPPHQPTAPTSIINNKNNAALP
ncbi:hypothetical protein PTTG_06128 [Puccinia triticina 1-1 BBBD Race 1]|uniref:FYVE domain-containing protein n=1 Tax=Puccinia triticina (isolate 1-1 / race 1 (BBBD)) TaxID=630390 RepID=A0A0C4EZ71_PUCT1|nr:hypothetical protein PTTG_06128 [Puccinia triticina 1-1 BBBD Race 1]